MNWNDLGVECLFECNISDRVPFVTVEMITWCHEKYIVKAVSSLLEGDSTDFELIISDDASPDDTPKVLLEYLKSYKGPVQVRYLRHLKNGGLNGRGHALVFETLRRGQIILKMDGDDFSMPHRIRRTVELWQSLSCEPSIMVVNAVRYIDAEEREDGVALQGVCSVGERVYFPPQDPFESTVPAFGTATVASRRFLEWTRQLPWIGERWIAGDVVTTRRALLDKGIWFVNEPIFFYRSNAQSVSGSGVAGKNWIHDRLVRFRQLEMDLRSLGGGKIAPAMQRKVDYWIRRTQFSESLIDCSNWIWPWRFIRFLFFSPAGAKGALKCRTKLLLLGNVNAPIRNRICIGSLLKTLKTQLRRRVLRLH